MQNITSPLKVATSFRIAGNQRFPLYGNKPQENEYSNQPTKEISNSSDGYYN